MIRRKKSKLLFIITGLVHYMLLMSTTSVVVLAFPSYLLSKTGCMTELDPTEVIMNFEVEEGDDPDFEIRKVVVGEDQNEKFSSKIVVGDQFPTTIQLQVVHKDKHNNAGIDMQYAMDVLPDEADAAAGDSEPAAYFENGSCTHKKRIAARSTEIVSITITRPGARVIAGWANGHEAVKLTKIVTFVDKAEEEETQGGEGEAEDEQDKDEQDELEDEQETDEEPEDGEQVDDDNPGREKIMDWADYVLHNCEDPVVSTESGTQFEGINVDPFSETKLQYSSYDVLDGTQPRVVIKLPDDVNFHQFVVETSKAGKFESPSSACNQKRLLMDDSDAWPILTVHDKSEKVTVWGMYSTLNENQRTTIHRTLPLEFQWKDDDGGQGKDASPRARKGDPQKKLEEKILSGMDLKARVEDYKKSREIKDRHVGKDDVRRENEAEDSRKKDEKEKTRREKKPRTLDDDRGPEGREATGRYKVDKTEPKLSAREDQKSDTEMFGFSMYGYYWGSAMFVVSSLLTTQLCLILSRRAGKGRRDL